MSEEMTIKKAREIISNHKYHVERGDAEIINLMELARAQGVIEGWEVEDSVKKNIYLL